MPVRDGAENRFDPAEKGSGVREKGRGGGNHGFEVWQCEGRPEINCGTVFRKFERGERSRISTRWDHGRHHHGTFQDSRTEYVFSPRILESSVMMSSVIPSRRYSASFTPLKFSKYSTAIDFGPAFALPDFESVVAAAAAFFPDSRSLFSRIKSVFSSVADWHRKFLSFSNVFSMIRPNSRGNPELTMSTGKGSRFRIESKITADVSPANGKAPVASWYNTVPSENKSVRASTSPPRACSGDIYMIVPIAEPGEVNALVSALVSSNENEVLSPSCSFSTFASPKSRIFTWPRSVMKIFAGLMSR